MKTTLVILASVLLVIVAIGVAYAGPTGTQSVAATVQVTGLVSVTVTPCSGFNFASGQPAANVAISCQGAGTAAIAVQNDPISNGNVAVSTNATNFVLNSTSFITNTKISWAKDNLKTGYTAIDGTFQTVNASVSPGNITGAWYWMDIPSGQSVGTYNGNIVIKTA